MFFQQLINGLAAGSIYAMVALGYTMIYGVLGIINLAQGELYMAGAFFAVILISDLHFGFLPAFISSLILVALLGVIIERLVFRPLRNTNPLVPLIAAIGLSFLLQSLARVLFGTNDRPFPIHFDSKNIDLFSIATVTPIDIYIFVFATILMATLTLFINKTRYGKAIVASATDRDTAKLMGINVDFMIMITFIIGSILSGAAGIMMAIAYNSTYPTMGVLPGLKAFSAAILGGVGSIPGAILGGLILGVAENLGSAYIASSLKDAIPFTIMIIVLIFRPTGLLGKRE